MSPYRVLIVDLETVYFLRLARLNVAGILKWMLPGMALGVFQLHVVGRSVLFTNFLGLTRFQLSQGTTVL